MRFITVRELRANTARLREELQNDREIVVTANGRPFALITAVDPDTVEDEVVAVRRARARAALSRIRARARSLGVDRLSADSIDAIVAKARGKRPATR